MNTCLLRPETRPRFPDARIPRSRAQHASVIPATSAIANLAAAHDFLVPNPRPDLTFDRQTLRMIEPV